MTDQPPPLKDPFAIESDDSDVRDASADGVGGREAGQAPILKDPFGRERTPVPVNRPAGEHIPTWAAGSAPPDFSGYHDAPAVASAAGPDLSVPPVGTHDEGVPGLSGRELTMPGSGSPVAAPDSDPQSTANAVPAGAGRVQLHVMPGGLAGPGRPFPGTAPHQPEGTGDQLTGRELTMPGMGAAPAPVGGLTGREMTMPGLGAAPAAPLGDQLTGREMTMPGVGSTPVDSSADGWLGSERTVSDARDGAQADGRREPTGGRERTERTVAVDPNATQPVDFGGRPKTAFGGKPRTGGTSVAFNDAWHLQGRQGPFTGQTWGDWEIGGILGEGGMGAVYRGKQKSLNRRVALKVLAPNLASDSKLLQRFLLEARMTSMLSSPNVVQVFAAGEWEGNHFFVMEYVEGRDLYDVIKDRKAENKPFTPDEAADVVIQAAKGLAEAGRHGIVHRDIKPPNLMVTKDGLVKVADFGIVKVMGESSLTMAGQAVGTPSYVSPEQGRGEADIDQRSDLYSLGVVFYELLCGKKPFEGTTPNALIYQHCYGEPELPRQVNIAISEAYQAVVLKCLQKKPEHRYQNAQELITDLEAIRNGNMLESALANYRQGTGADEAKRENMSWAQRHLLKLVAAAVVVLLVGGAGIIAIKHRVDVEKAKEEDLRKGLVALDQAVSLPPNVDDRLRDLAALVSGGENNADVQRWRSKVAQVRSLAATLKIVDGAALNAAQRVAAKTTLDAYVRQVGAKDQDALRWTDALDRIQKNEDELRNVFRRAETEALDLPRRTVLSEPLAKLAALVPDNDAQVRKWTQAFREFDDQVKGMVDSLTKLDALPKITEADRQAFGQILARAKPLLGAEDERIVRWQDLLARSRSRVDGYRTAIRERLAKEDQPSKQSQEAIKSDLVALRALVDAKDADIVAWDEQIAAANAVYDGLKKELAKLDALPKGETLEIALIQPTADNLARLKRLALPGDADLRRWEERVQMSRDYLADLRERLKPLDGTEPLSLAQQSALAEAMERFAAKGALDPDVRKGWRKRLDDEAARVVALRQELIAFTQRTVVSQAMRDGLDRLGKDVGEADPDVQKWRAKLARVDALRAQLAVLDLPTGTPLDIDIPLARLSEEIGDENVEMVRWTPKVKRLKEADLALRPLDIRVPLPPDASIHLAVLREIAGEQNPTYIRRQGKFDRVGAIKATLAKLPAAYGQSPEAYADAHALLAELVQLITDSDADVRAWAARQAVLDGPGAPAWASDSGRDGFGLWAQLTVGKTTQRFRFIPPGSFTAGSPANEPGRESDELPVDLTLSRAFWLADTECTQALWAAIGGGAPSRHPGEERPVERVSWDDAHAACARITTTLATASAAATATARLPTEAEWEYACRAGGSGPFTTGRSDQTDPLLMTWCAANASASKDVRLRVPNPLGLYDLHGNVWEWCEDRHGAYPTTATVDHIGRDGAMRVVRGGSWGDPLGSCRAANRAGVKPSLRSAYIGLRLAIDVTWSDGVPPDGRALLNALAAVSGKPDTRAPTVLPTAPAPAGGERNLSSPQPVPAAPGAQSAGETTAPAVPGSIP